VELTRIMDVTRHKDVRTVTGYFASTIALAAVIAFWV
jgi:hypothetical protein